MKDNKDGAAPTSLGSLFHNNGAITEKALEHPQKGGRAKTARKNGNWPREAYRKRGTLLQICSNLMQELFLTNGHILLLTFAFKAGRMSTPFQGIVATQTIAGA